jgi:hypothetical protein
MAASSKIFSVTFSRPVSQKLTDVSEVLTASIIRAMMEVESKSET